jgi:hypothetical protein
MAAADTAVRVLQWAAVRHGPPVAYLTATG